MDDCQSFTYVDEVEIASSRNVNCEPICINLLPGENFITFDLLNFGCRFSLTNFRIIIIFDILKDKISASDIISIPLGLVYHIEQHGFICLNIVTKIGRKFSVTFPNIELCDEIVNKIKNARALEPFSIEFCRRLKMEFPYHFLLNNLNEGNNQDAIEHHMIEGEFKRLKFSSEQWKISDVNKNLKLCSTYPQFHIVPKIVSDEMITHMSKFRSQNRFLSVTYRCTETGTVMMRSSQPLTGMSGWRNNSDEEYFSLINDLNKHSVIDNKNCCLKIFDARTYTSAQLNKVHGGGMEFEGYYQNSIIEFMNIPNMHTIRSAFDKFSMALLACDDDNFHNLVNRSNWLQLIRQLLKTATSISDAMYSKKQSVLIHCSDGWDRTSQLTSLSQLIIDPYYRTIEGFKTLIYREWILYGHKFNARCALWPFDFSNEYSPIFLQWLDCVYQLLHQFPDYFHFNETFLIKLAIHVYSGLFGTFNSSLSKSYESCSIWSYLCQKDIHNFINPLYSPHTTFKIMRPKIKMLNIQLWSKLYFESLNPNYHDIQDLEKYNCEIPSELNNISMFNSLIMAEEEMNDYEGEDVKYQPSLLTDSLNEVKKPLTFRMSVQDNLKPNNYFNKVFLKWSLESLELKPINEDDSKIHFELDLDGLYKQKDFIDKFSDNNRHCRRLYKCKLDSYRKEIDYLNKLNRNNVTSNSIATINEEEVETNSSSSEEIVFDACDFVIVEEIVRWVPDHAATICASCPAVFGLLTRKHHCRSCGKVFCHECSKYKCPVPKQKFDTKVRVCKKCFEKLQPSTEVSTLTHSSSIIRYFI